METLPCWEQQVLCGFLLHGTGAPGSCWAPSYCNWSQCPSWRAKLTTWLITLLLWKAKASSCFTQQCSDFNSSQESMHPWWSYTWNLETSQTYESSPANILEYESTAAADIWKHLIHLQNICIYCRVEPSSGALCRKVLQPKHYARRIRAQVNPYTFVLHK